VQKSKITKKESTEIKNKIEFLRKQYDPTLQKIRYSYLLEEKPERLITIKISFQEE